VLGTRRTHKFLYDFKIPAVDEARTQPLATDQYAASMSANLQQRVDTLRSYARPVPKPTSVARKR
jgi:hypothetical protein